MQYVLIATKLAALIALVTIIFFIGKQALKWFRMYYYLRHLPHVEERWPFSLFLDTWTALRRMDRHLPITAKLFNYMQEITSKIYEQEVTVAYYGPQPFVIGISPTLFEAILSSTVNLNKSFIYRMMKPWMGNGVLTSDKELWRTRRKILTPAFHFKTLRNYVPIMNRRTNHVVEKLMKKEATAFDILPVLRQAAFGMLFETAMGVNINEEEVASKRLLCTTDELAASIISRVLNVFLWPDAVFNMTQEGKTFLRKVQYIRDYNKKIIQQRKAEYVSGGTGTESRKSFLDILLRMHIDEGTLTEHEVAEEVATFFIGESMRLYPPVPLVARNIDEDVHVGSHIIPKGTVVLCAIYFLHRHPGVYADANSFIPERFMDNRNISPYAYVPFSAGSRNCIGQKFAQLEEKILLAQILRNFHVESVVPIEDLKLQLEIVLRPLQGIQVRLTPRHRTGSR
ncbi:cytochrome P450 4V2-like isoform X2 [Amblyomma americanum]